MNKAIKDGIEELQKHTQVIVLSDEALPNTTYCGQSILLKIAHGCAIEEQMPILLSSNVSKELSNENVKVINSTKHARNENVTTYIPSNAKEITSAIIAAGTQKGPVHVVIPKNFSSRKISFENSDKIREGGDCTIIALADEADNVLENADKSEAECTIISISKLPIETDKIERAIRQTGCAVIAEDKNDMLFNETAKNLAHLPVPIIKSEGQTRQAILDALIAKIQSVKPKHCSSENAFILEGRNVTSIKHLCEELYTESDSVFKKHCNGLKNDFAKWADEVFNEHNLAAELRTKKTKLGMIAVMSRFV